MIVPPSGPSNSPRLAIVGDAPNKHDAREGKPFSAAQGMLLNKMLANAGVSRAEVYCTNVIQSPTANFGIYYDDKKKTKPSQSLLNAHENLRRELRRVNPTVVIPVGEEALRAVGQVKGVSNYRGTPLQTSEFKILPTYHPFHILRGAAVDKVVVEADLRKANRLAGKWNIHVPNVITEPTLQQCVDYFKANHRFIGFDIETLGSVTRSLGFAWSDSDAISIPLIWKGQSYWSEEEEALILHLVKDHLADPTVLKVIQNLPFDCSVIAKEFGFVTEGVHLDTMYAHHLLYPELPKGLDFLSSLHTDFPMYWGSFIHDSDAANALYNGYDCCATVAAAKAIEIELRERDMWEFYQREIHPGIFALTRMQHRGIKVDQEKRAKVRETTVARLEAIKERLHLTLGTTLNPSSPKQVATLVYSTWRLPPVINRSTKKATTDDDALKALARKFPERSSVLNDITDYRKAKVLLGTFIDVPLPADGKMRTSYNLAGQVTGRISSSKTWSGEGGNLTNIPRGEFRDQFCADPGKLLIKADYAQADFRAVVWIAKVRRLIDRYTTDHHFDVHRWNAAENVYLIPPEQVTKAQRQEAKVGVHGANYGIQPLKVSKTFNIPLDRAKLINERYHAAIPEIKLWWLEVQSLLRTTRKVKNPLGRERLFLGELDDNMFREAYGHLGQSTVADAIIRAMVTLDSQGVELLLQVHDELVSQCPVADVPRVVGLVRAAMEEPIIVDGVPEPLIIPADISVGPTWYDQTPFEEWIKKNDVSKLSQ